MINISHKQRGILESKAVALATSDKDGNVNVIAVACVKVIGKDKLLITDNFMYKTRKNILENNHVAVAFWSNDEERGWQFKGVAKYLTTGKYKKMVDEMEENKGLAHKAAVLVTVEEIYDLANP